MTINVSAASRELTAFSRVINRDGERAQIRRAKREYFANGGLMGIYGTGMAYDAPTSAVSVVRLHGRDKIIHHDVADYVRGIKARKESEAARKRRLMDDAIAARAERIETLA